MNDAPPADFRVNNFDLIRLGAALQVAIVHVVNQLKVEGPVSHVLAGALYQVPGVPIFFFISGLLVSRSFEHSPGLRDYLRNRALRIYPALWVCLVVTLVMLLASGFGSLGAASPLDWLQWWAAQMSVFQAQRPAFFSGYATGALNASLWTIPVELTFYLVLPALYALLGLRARRRTLLLTGLLLLSLCVHFVFFNWEQLTTVPGPPLWLGAGLAPHLWMFLTGVLVQRNFESLRPWFAQRVLPWLAACLVTMFAARALHLGVGGANINPVSFLALAGLVMACAFSMPRLSQRLLGDNDISYGFYIYHLPVLNLMLVSGFARTAGAAFAVLGLTLVLATASWFCVERPFLRRKRGAANARQRTTPVVTAGVSAAAGAAAPLGTNPRTT